MIKKVGVATIVVMVAALSVAGCNSSSSNPSTTPSAKASSVSAPSTTPSVSAPIAAYGEFLDENGYTVNGSFEPTPGNEGHDEYEYYTIYRASGHEDPAGDPATYAVASFTSYSLAHSYFQTKIAEARSKGFNGTFENTIYSLQWSGEHEIPGVNPNDSGIYILLHSQENAVSWTVVRYSESARISM